MGFTLWNLAKATLLVLNALAVLHPWRFLYPTLGIGSVPRKVQQATGQTEIDRNSLEPWKRQLHDFLDVVRRSQYALIGCNLVVIVIELLLGG